MTELHYKLRGKENKKSSFDLIEAMTVHKDLLISESKPLKWIQYVVYGSLILYFGRNIFIPISFALLISFVLYPICAWFERKGLGCIMSIAIAITLLMVGIAKLIADHNPKWKTASMILGVDTKSEP